MRKKLILVDSLEIFKVWESFRVVRSLLVFALWILERNYIKRHSIERQLNEIGNWKSPKCIFKIQFATDSERGPGIMVQFRRGKKNEKRMKLREKESHSSAGWIVWILRRRWRLCGEKTRWKDLIFPPPGESKFNIFGLNERAPVWQKRNTEINSRNLRATFKRDKGSRFSLFELAFKRLQSEDWSRRSEYFRQGESLFAYNLIWNALILLTRWNSSMDEQNFCLNYYAEFAFALINLPFVFNSDVPKLIYCTCVFRTVMFACFSRTKGKIRNYKKLETRDVCRRTWWRWVGMKTLNYCKITVRWFLENENRQLRKLLFLRIDHRSIKLLVASRTFEPLNFPLFLLDSSKRTNI